MERFCDPAFCALCGVVFGIFSKALGFWLMFAACTLFVIEIKAYFKMRELDMDMMDGLIFAENQGDTVEKFEATPAKQQGQEAAIATGLGNDIASKIKQKQQRR